MAERSKAPVSGTGPKGRGEKINSRELRHQPQENLDKPSVGFYPPVMASAAFLRLPSSSSALPFKSNRPFSPQFLCVSKNLSFTVKASTSLDYSAPSKSASISKSNSSSWKWKFEGNSVNIHFETLEKEGADDRPRKNILMVPTISDVSTIEEWRLVAEEIVGKNGEINWSATIVDWPGLGYSDRPKLDYNAGVMEKFLVDFVGAPDSPISNFVAGV
ncbi:UNVERIFIED_CONTAM: hypothetical protein Sradi_2887400 [Sesamum radiatum]|uniref:Uncharacterized protein n=1 Tax=Sesamum radiatum TaxID=300843 RepID=A0AAW2RZP7_SESRA